MTKFLEDHPGGDDVLLSSTGLSKPNYQHALPALMLKRQIQLVDINPSVFDPSSLFR